MKLLLLLSGPVAVGKSAVATTLVQDHGFQSIKSSTHLKSLAADRGLTVSRTALQQLGDILDEQTDFGWLIEDVAGPAIDGQPHRDFWLLDCVRKKRQVEHFRDRFGADVLHVHLNASEEVLEKRYADRLAAGGETGNVDYPSAKAHPNEIAARNLIEIADLVIDLGDTPAQAAASAILGKSKERGG